MSGWRGVLMAVVLATGINLAAGELKWRTNYNQALNEAAAQKRKVLLLFTGSDWCKYCIILEEKVLSQEAFIRYAEQELIPVKIDFPREKKMLPIQQKMNEELQEKFGVEGYPTVLLVDAKGNELGKVNTDVESPEEFINAIKNAGKEPALPPVTLPTVLGKPASRNAVAIYHQIKLPPDNQIHTARDYDQALKVWMKSVLIDKPLAQKAITTEGAAWLDNFVEWYKGSNKKKMNAEDGYKIVGQGNDSLYFLVPLYAVGEAQKATWVRDLNRQIISRLNADKSSHALLWIIYQKARNRDALNNVLSGIVAGDFDQAPLRYVYHHLFPLAKKMKNGDNLTRLRQTLKQRPQLDPWISDALEGKIEYEIAYEWRGSGWADSVTDEGWKEFHRHSKIAYEYLEKAWKRHPELPEPAIELISLTNSNCIRNEIMIWCERALTAQVDHSDICGNMLWALRPRWGGSWDQMLAFGQKIADGSPALYNTSAPLAYLWAVQNVAEEIFQERGMKACREFLREQTPGVKKVMNQMITAAEKSQHAGNVNRRHVILMRYLWSCGNYEEAKAELAKVRWADNWISNVCGKPGYMDLNYEDMVTEIKMATGKYAALYRDIDQMIARNETKQVGCRWIQAAKETNDATEKKLFERNATIAFLDKKVFVLKKEIGIFLLAHMGQVEGVKTFLDAGYPVNGIGEEGCPLLLCTLRHDCTSWQEPNDAANKIAVIKLLVSRGADIKARSGAGWTLLHMAIAGKQPLDVVKFVLDQKGGNVNDGDVDGETPLIWCAMLDRTEPAKLLLANGANVNAQANNGETALDRAKSQDMAALLRQAGGKSGKDVK